MRGILMTIVSAGLVLGGVSCEKEVQEPVNPIVYKTDGRSVMLMHTYPLALDVTGDGLVDFTLFMELTANSRGDRLYAGINPIGANQVKSGPPIDENFLSMGHLVAEMPGVLIDGGLEAHQRWTPDYGALVIRNTLTNGSVFYEGQWAANEQLVAIQNRIEGAVYYGWLRIKFDPVTEVVTLVDYAYHSIAGCPIIAGATED